MINEELIISPKSENLDKIISFIDNSLKDIEVPSKSKFQLDLVLEEIFVNIVNYSKTESIKVTSQICDSPLKIIIKFIDNGIEFNPLEQEDNNVHLELEEKPIGGLGLILIKNNVDEISYKYYNNENHLTISKKL